MTRAITLIGICSDRCNRRISAQSSTANTRSLPGSARARVSGGGQLCAAARGSVFRRRRQATTDGRRPRPLGWDRSGEAARPSVEPCAYVACRPSDTRSPRRVPAGEELGVLSIPGLEGPRDTTVILRGPDPVLASAVEQGGEPVG